MPTDAERIAALEHTVAELQREVRELRAGLQPAPSAAPPAGAGAPPLAAAPWAPPTLPPRPPTLRERAAAYARAQAAGLGVPTAGDAQSPDVEALVGRYGTVAVAALLILTGVGAFLTWAVNTFTITPAARVAMGAGLAAAMAAAGWRLRTRASSPTAVDQPAPDTPALDAIAAAGREGTRRFGDVLLALALAVTHVDAWAAGPYLGLVPPAAALAVAALASAALAALAWRAGQQSLFVVGVGGALVAPFVTGSAIGRPLALFAYGWVVLTAGLFALPRDAATATRWRAAARLLALGGAGYTFALLGDALGGDPENGPAAWGWLATWRRPLPALFALACAAVPLARAARRSSAGGPPPDGTAALRPTLGGLALAYLTAGAGALAPLGFEAAPTGDVRLVGLALLTTLGVYAGVATLTSPAPAGFEGAPPPHRVRLVGTLLRVTTATAALVLPLALLADALVALDEVVGGRGATVAGLWTVMAAVAAWRQFSAGAPLGADRDQLTSAHLAVAGLASALIPVFLLSGHDVARVTLLAAHAAVAAQLFVRIRRPLTLLAPATVGCVAAAWAAVLLTSRPAYAYTPFLTPESLAGGAVVIAWSAIALRVWRDGGAAFSQADRRLAVAAAVGVALLWGRQEFAEAVSPDVSTFLLIGYFAAAGIGAIALGRARAVPAARQIGLALALYAALKAFVQASTLDAVGLRVGSYLLVGGFLLAVGYWYRAAGVRPAPTPAARSDAPAATGPDAVQPVRSGPA